MLGGLLLLVVFLSSPVDNTNAATDFDITVQPVLEVSLSPSLHLTFETDNVLHSGSIDLNVLSNSRNGFTATVSTIYDSSDVLGTSLTNTIDNNLRINTLTGSNIAAADFPTNRWGYSVDGGTTFNAMPGVNEPAIVLDTNSAAGNGDKSIYIGTKVDTSTASGTYENALLITVVPKYVPISLKESFALASKHRVAGVDGHNYYAMQDMTPAICDRSDELEDQTQVVDVRDQKIYWVAKLRDGNCWMTQNLDFDIKGNNVVPETSDVEVAWNNSSTYSPQVTSTEIFTSDTATDTYSYDPGDYYIEGGMNSNNLKSAECETGNGGENCHYHLGNYYQWNAATAGSGGTITGHDATQSICPKGWKMPIIDSNYENKNLSISKLTNAYGITNNSNGTSDANLRAAPLYFVRGGRVVLDSNNVGTMSSIGGNGFYWSILATDVAYARATVFWGSYVGPKDNYKRTYGFSVRCVAAGNNFTLIYDNNGGGGISAIQKDSSPSDFITMQISSVVPAGVGTFLGWATSSTATTPDYVYDSSTGTFTPSTITFTGPTMTLYAVWQTVSDPHAYGYPIMQEVAEWGKTLTEEVQVQALDARDGKLYWVAKLADGNVWMTQNLDFDIKGNNVVPETSDVEVAWNSSSTYSPQVTSVELFNSNVYNDTYSYDPGSYYKDGGNSTNAAAVNCTGNKNDGANCHYHLGNFYQWNAATAGSGGLVSSGQKAAYSICPKGWHLPVGNSYTENYSFGKLTNAYGITNSADGGAGAREQFMSTPIYGTIAGMVRNGGQMYMNGDIYLWSSLSVTNSGAYLFYASGSTLRVISTGTKYIGIPVRCVAGVEHEVTFSIYDNSAAGYGTISASSITVPDGAAISVSYHGLSADIAVGDTTVTATGSTTFAYTYGVDTVLHDSCGNNVFDDCNIVVVFNVNSSSDVHPNMQQMTPSLCASIPIGAEGQLIDSRDNKLYWVAKLADGNCWMTQNLDYDIEASGNVVSKNDGTTTTWSPGTPTSTDETVLGEAGSLGTYSYNPGDSIVCTSTSNGGANCHNHLGNFYQWNAAIAGVATSTSIGVDATQSICPQGWRLPTSNDYTSKYSFGRLFDLYGLTSQGVSNVVANATALTAAPFYMTNEGYIDETGSWEAPQYGYYWAAIKRYDEWGLSLNFSRYGLDGENRTIVYNAVNDANCGFPIRCVAI